MKIVTLSGLSRSAGGLFYAVNSLCKSLDDCGVEVEVFGRNDRRIGDDQSAWAPVRATAYKAYGPTEYAPDLRRMLAGSSAHLVHQHGIWKDDQWAALQWGKKTGRPVVVSPHGMLEPWALQYSAWKKWLVEKLFAREALEQAKCLHALCQREAESIRAYGLKNPVAIIPNGVALPELSPRRMQRECENKCLLFLGRIHPKKGVKELISAWAQVQRRRADACASWKLLIAGWDDGGHEQGLKELAASTGIANSIEFIGPRFGVEKDALMRSVDAFILPSFSEGLPMTVLEAWSYGLPVVMTDFCNLPEGINAGAAIRVEPSVESIYSGLVHLAELSSEQLVEMGAKGRTLVEESFTWPRIASQMKDVYNWCIHGGPQPSCMILE